MNTFKSWIVANLELLLILLTILFLAVSALSTYHHFKATADENCFYDFVALALFILVICAISVFCIRNGFLSLVVLILFVGLPIIGSASEDTGILAEGIWKQVEWTRLLGVAVPAFLFGLVCSIYANRNFDDVVSRRFLYRNSTVSVFEEQWKYTFNRFYAGFMTVFAFALEIILFLALKP